MPTRSLVSRAAAAVCTLGVLVLCTAVPADAATAVWRGYGANLQLTVRVGGTVYPAVRAGVMRLEVNGLPTAGYCIEFFNDRLDDTPYVDVPWASAQAATALPNVNWILRNSYPNVGLAALAARIGVSSISADEAGAATQAAIWRYTEPGFDIVRTDPSITPAVAALYDDLTGSANVGLPQPPRPLLSVSPTAASGTAGTRIGSFTVSTSGTSLSVSVPSPGQVVDTAGAPISTVGNGTVFSVVVPPGTAPGSLTVTVSGTVQLGVGTVFITPDTDTPNQEQITAEVRDEPVQATVSVSWTAASTTTTAASTTTTAASTTTTAASTTTSVASTTTSVTVLGTTTVPGTTTSRVATTVPGSTTSTISGGNVTTTPTVLGTTTVPGQGGQTLPRTGADDGLRTVLAWSGVLLVMGAALVAAQVTASRRRA